MITKEEKRAILDVIRTGSRTIWCDNKPVGIDLTINYNPSRIIKTEKATVVFWDDGSKTIVKRSANDPDDDYAAFTAAFAIKMFGSNSKVHRIVDKTEVVVKKRKKK